MVFLKNLTRWLWVPLIVLALPAPAQECVSGMPKQVIYQNGGVITIIQRHGEDFTYSAPYLGGNSVVSKTHLGIFPRDSRLPSRYFEYRWSDRLPKLADLVPGYHFDISGKMAAGKDTPRDYRITGDVLGEEADEIGGCSFRVLTIAKTTFINGVPVETATLRFSPEMMLVVSTEGTDATTGKKTAQRVVGLQ